MSEASIASGDAGNEPTAASSRHIRSSMLLLSGRFISLALHFAAQVAVVRYLSKADYGTFAFAVSLVEIASMLTALGIDKATSRFVPIYHEQRDFSRMFGAIFLGIGVMVGLGLATIALVFGLQGLITQSLDMTPSGMMVLLVLILMTPVGAIDALLLSVFTVFAQARLIFVRRYVIGPCLKLTAAALVIYLQGNVVSLAVAHVLAGTVGLMCYAVMLVQVLRKERLLEQFKARRVKLPTSDVMGFGLPLLGANVAVATRTFLIVALLQILHSATSVAEFRAILPIARLNGVALVTFSLMFTPIAARLFARKDHRSLSEMYWRSAAWTAVVTFPIFAVCVSLPSFVAELFFGQRYASAGTLLAILAVGYYFQAALGLNAGTLQVLGKLRPVVAIDCFLTVVAVGLFMVLIPRYGALGGAISASATMVLRGVLNQIALVRHSYIRWFEPQYAGVFGSVLVSALLLIVVHWTLTPPTVVSVALALFATIVVVIASHSQLQLDRMFPELQRFAVMRRLLGSAP